MIEKKEIYRPRRSALYMPAANPRALEKARTLDADVLIFDLEDSVAPEAKHEGRDHLAAAMHQGGYEPREIVIRINHLTTPWGVDDLAVAARLQPAAVLVPKVNGAADLVPIREALPSEIAIWAMIETPHSLFNLMEIAGAGLGLSCLIMGTNDLVKEMRGQHMAGRANLISALSLAVWAARAHDLTILDGVYNSIDDAEGFAAECAQGVAFGFDGKTLIHPSQLLEANRLFAPSAEAVAQARDVIDAFNAPENQGKGVLRVNGQMAELLHRDTALRLVALDTAIRERQ